MATILNGNEVDNAKAWLHDVFVWGGIAQPSREIPLSRYRYMYGQDPVNNKNKKYQQYAKIICDAIMKRPVGVKEFQIIDDALENLSHCAFTPSIKAKNRFEWVKKSKEDLAKYIAWFCKENELWWLNKNKMVYEMDEIRKYSTLGKTLWDNYLFYYGNNEPEDSITANQSTYNDNATGVDASAPAQTTTASQQPQPTGKKQPINPFKSRGPLSGVAVDLIGTPGQKVKLYGMVYTLNGFVNGSPVEDCAYVRPVEEKNQQKYMSGATNKLLFGKAKGYGYCQLFFRSRNEADAYLNAVYWPKLTSMVVGVTIARANSNGYFEVGTEFGPALISAAKLNEDLVEEVEEPTKQTVRDKWKKFEELFTKD